jgi:hypothetical protein
MATSTASKAESVQALARLLDTVDFETIIQIVSHIDNGWYDILPYITKVYSESYTINQYNLTKCCRTKTLILPNCIDLRDNALMMLPNLESLTIRSGNPITSEVFQHLPYVTKLQILSHNSADVDTLLDYKALRHLGQLEMLQLYSDTLCNEHFRLLPNLKILILDGNRLVTPGILNFLPRMEVCIINKVLCKFVASTRNNAIIKRIGKLDCIRIHSIEK